MKIQNFKSHLFFDFAALIIPKNIKSIAESIKQMRFISYFLLVILFDNCSFKNEKIDNILDVKQIIEIQSKAIQKQEPYYYFSYLASIDTNSYYLNSEIAYYTQDDNVFDEIKSKFKDIDNTFTLAIQAIGIDYDSSIQLLEKSIEMDKHHLNRVAYRMLLYNYVQLNDSIKILSFIKDFQKSSIKNDLEVSFIWSNYLINKGEYQKAIDFLIDFSKKFKIENYEIKNLIGESLIRLGKYDEAEIHVKNSINLLSRNDFPYYLLSVINRERNNLNLAKTNIEKAIKLKKDNYLYYWQLASLTQETNGNNELVYKNYDLALIYCKTNEYYTILNNLFGFLINIKDYKKLDYHYHLNKERSTSEIHNSIYDIMYLFHVENDAILLNQKYNELIFQYPNDEKFINEMLIYFNVSKQKVNQKL
jgi:tetratricopeptide (TPR) repeat protein